MEKSLLIQAIGAPFDLSKSSCGSRVPETFSWSNSPQKIKVLIDHALNGGLYNNNKTNKFGWTCESKAIIPGVFDGLVHDIEKYKESYTNIFTYDENLVNLDPVFFKYCPPGSNTPWTPINEYGIHNKTKLVSFLCSNNSMTNGHKYRLFWAERLKDKVDMYGGACGSKQLGGHCYHHQPKTEAMNDYMFSIVIENIKMDGYFTEKITDCFANGVIPVYYGTDKIRYFDSNGIIKLTEDFDVSQLSKELYLSKLKHVENNLEITRNMLTSDDMVAQEIIPLLSSQQTCEG
jgi:hypothetical protein